MTHKEETEKFKKDLILVTRDLENTEKDLSELRKIPLLNRNSEYYMIETLLNKKKIHLEVEKEYLEKKIKEGIVERKFNNGMEALVKVCPPPVKVIEGGFMTKPVYSGGFGCLLLIWAICAVLFLIMYITIM